MVFKILMSIINSVWHVYILLALGIILVILPIAGVSVSQQVELIGGNYTNVISAIGATIAAGTSIKNRVAHHKLRQDMNAILNHIHAGHDQPMPPFASGSLTPPS